ncbi:MAG: hypothetical protein KDC95_05465 [Planctomycetes bacterium]|nr:hypothetical protein [Planctomycetota bacterium]
MKSTTPSIAALTASLLLALPGLVRAQRTLRVDATGFGGAFTRIQPALDAAQPSDTITVKAGTYEREIYVRKGVHLVGEPGVQLTIEGLDTPRIFVLSVPAGQSATVRAIGAVPILAGVTVEVGFNVGHVHLEDLTIRSGIYQLQTTLSSIEQCSNVTLSHCDVVAGGLGIDASTVAMTGCTIRGSRPKSGYAQAPLQLVNGSRVWFAEGQCTALQAIFGAPAVDVIGSTLFVAGDGTTSLTPLGALSAVQTTGAASSVVVDSHVTLPSNAHSGTGRFRIATVPSMLVSYSTVSSLDTRLFAPGANIVVTLFSLPAASPVLAGGLGDVYVSSTHFVLDIGPLLTGGVRRSSTTIPSGLLRGVPVVVQGLAVYPNEVLLTAPAPTTIGR